MATNQRRVLKATIGLGQAVAAPKAKSANGGTTAPQAAGHGPTSGVGPARVAPPRVAVGPGHPAPVSAAPPGAGGGAPAVTPAVSGALPPPETQQRLRERDESNSGYSNASGSYQYGLYQAALKYGDPSVIALYGNSADPPTGATQEIAKRETSGQKTNSLAHNANNTFFSGMNLDDVKNISDEANNERARALQEFEAAKHDLDQIWLKAQQQHMYEEEGFNEGAQREFEETAPTPQATAGPSGGAGAAPKAPSGGNKPKPKVVQNTTIHAPSSQAVGQAQALRKKAKK